MHHTKPQQQPRCHTDPFPCLTVLCLDGPLGLLCGGGHHPHFHGKIHVAKQAHPWVAFFCHSEFLTGDDLSPLRLRSPDFLLFVLVLTPLGISQRSPCSPRSRGNIPPRFDLATVYLEAYRDIHPLTYCSALIAIRGVTLGRYTRHLWDQPVLCPPEPHGEHAWADRLLEVRLPRSECARNPCHVGYCTACHADDCAPLND